MNIGSGGGSGNDHGGSLLINDNSFVIILRCHFLNNEAIDDGGAIYIHNSIIQMINITMSNNKCGWNGGTIMIWYKNVTMINMIMTNNTAYNVSFEHDDILSHFNFVFSLLLVFLFFLTFKILHVIAIFLYL